MDQSSSTLADAHNSTRDLPITETLPGLEKVHEKDREASLLEYQPIGSRVSNPQTPKVLSRSGSKPASLQHTRSYGDGHGFTYFSDDESHAVEARRRDNSEREFEVQWDGDSDPANPRRMSKLRKWMVVLIVSSSSACVYVNGDANAVRRLVGLC